MNIVLKFLISEIGFISVPGESFNIQGLNLRLSLVHFKIIEGLNININNMVNGIKELINLLKKL